MTEEFEIDDDLHAIDEPSQTAVIVGIESHPHIGPRDQPCQGVLGRRDGPACLASWDSGIHIAMTKTENIVAQVTQALCCAFGEDYVGIVQDHPNSLGVLDAEGTWFRVDVIAPRELEETR